MNQGTPISLTDEHRIELERRVRSQTLDARSVRRARIVLFAADGAGNHEIARRMDRCVTLIDGKVVEIQA